MNLLEPSEKLLSFSHRKPLKYVGLPVILLLMVGVYYFVYATGGIRYVYSHSMYLPIILASFLYGAPGGLIAGVAGGIILGPFMPINTETGEMQKTLNWAYRLGFFSAVGFSAGFAIDLVRHQLDQMRWNATHDAETSLPNRMALCQVLAQRLRENPKSQISLAVCSLDNYYPIVNTIGLTAGEKVIQGIADRLKDTLSENQHLICHTQRDRFTLLFCEENLEAARAKLDALLDSLLLSFEVEGVPLYADITSGLASYPDHEKDPESLIRKANIALHYSQQTGRRVSIYREESFNLSRGNMALLGEIPQALKEEHFELHYHPKIEIRTNQVVGVEALLRWNHPQKGRIPPGAFIPMAENTGIINPLTHWVIQASLTQLAEWRRRGLDIIVSFNVSVRNFSHDKLFIFLKEKIDELAIPPDRIELEITESAIMAEPALAKKRLDEMKNLGVRLAIDDFGTGQSSLAYLKKLPVDVIKIDQVFVGNMAKEKGDRKIVQAAIDLGRSFNLNSTAEGVEDKSVLAMLDDFGCDAAQGFYFCKPLPALEFIEWLDHRSARGQ